MANQIALISKYLPLLDEKYQYEAKSSILDLDSSLVRETMEAKSILLPRMELSGLADYNRNGGYTAGNQTLEWETHTFTQDRGRMFTVDTMDDLETAYVAYSRLAGEFIRLHVAPELDSYRFSRYATLAANKATPATVDETNVLKFLVAGRTTLVNKQVPTNDIVIFVTPDAYGALMMTKDIGKYMGVDKVSIGNIQLDVQTFNSMPIIEVPAERMMTAYTFYDGTTGGQEDGGFNPAPASGQINFMMVARSAVMQIVKRAQPKIIAPDDNQTSDGWKFGYRIYHDAFVPINKTPGIYVHTAS